MPDASETTDLFPSPADEGKSVLNPDGSLPESVRRHLASQAAPAMTRVAFVGMASRIAQRAAHWAADCAQYPGPERQGEPIEREAALRFCASIEELLALVKEDARG